jgi:hypothetical protein
MTDHPAHDDPYAVHSVVWTPETLPERAGLVAYRNSPMLRI